MKFLGDGDLNLRCLKANALDAVDCDEMSLDICGVCEFDFGMFMALKEHFYRPKSIVMVRRV